MKRFNEEKYKEDMIKDIISIVDIPSVYTEDESPYPFGKPIQEALEKTIELSKRLGFKTTIDSEGYYGYAEIGDGEELVGILGHLDVVPAEDLENWTYNPFEAKYVDGKIYGRGVQDDKGPTIATMYAAKQLLDEGYKFNKRLRFIFGTDEENLWRGIQKYMEKEEKPSFGFTPDSVFPMIHAEKGLLQLVLTGEGRNDLKIQAGNSFNALADKATIEMENLDEVEHILKKLGFEYKCEGNKLTVIGKSAHSAKPEAGINAINRLAVALKKAGFKIPAAEFISDVLGTSHYGENIVGEWKDFSGKLTINVGMLTINEEKSEISLDIRIPVSFEKEEFVENLSKFLDKYKLTSSERDFLGAIHVPLDHVLVKTLGDVFNEVTGLDSTPLTSGGATYARAMPNCVAFGAVLPGKPKTEHQANEYIDIEDFMTATTIYLNAIAKLVE